jgi:membrane protease YdiL (CAAX protease family)
MAALLAALVAGALFLPGVYYDGTLPRISGTIFLAPVSTAERLFMILVAASAGIAEEVQYRGLPFTRLGPVLGSPWFVLPITMVSFLFVHGGPDSVQMAINYLAIGMAFGVAFLLLRRRRLEWLMLIHFLIDASMVLAP